MAEKSEMGSMKAVCMICGRDTDEGIHGHPEIPADVQEAMGLVVTLDACDHYCCGKTSFLCKAEKLAQRDRERDAAIVERCKGIIEARRCRILETPDDPSWTEHFAELQGELDVAFPNASRALELVKLRARLEQADRAVGNHVHWCQCGLCHDRNDLKCQVEKLEKQQPEVVNAIHPNLR